jgi:Family of unknown function (DUF6152)
MKKLLFAVLVVALIGPALAHHSGAMFDHTKTVTLRGTVKEFQYTNPHSWLEVMVRGSDGTLVQWGFECEGPSTLLRAGIKAKTFQPGDKVTVVANPMRDGRPAGSLISATAADGIIYRPFGRAPPARKL